MNDPLIEHFRGLVHSRKALSDRLTKLSKSLSSLLSEQLELYAETRSVNRKIDDLTKENRSSLSERAELRLGVEIQSLKAKMETIKNEARDMDVVVKEYRNQQQEIWGIINKDWKKQCEIWDEINPFKIPNADE